MTFYNRNGILYARINGRRISTKLKDTKENRKLFKSYSKNEEFFEKFNVSKQMPKVLQLCEEVLSDMEKDLKPSSYKTYFSNYKCHILPYFDIYVNEPDPIFIKNWYKHFSSLESITTAECILKPAFEKAILSKHIKSTPFVVSKPKLKSDYEINPFSIEEMRSILTYDSNLKNLLAFAFFTGMRIGEIIALTWSDIDFKNKKIDINKQCKNGIIQEPKTKTSKAIIDLPIELKPFLNDQRFKTGMRDHIFYSDKNKPFLSSSSVSYHYHKILNDLNIQERGIHQTRHTFASQKLSIGERLEWVSFMLRHTSPRITLDIYYKYIPRENEKRVILDLGLTQNRHSS